MAKRARGSLGSRVWGITTGGTDSTLARARKPCLVPLFFGLLAAAVRGQERDGVTLRNLEVAPLSLEQRAENQFDAMHSAGLFVGVREFLDADGEPGDFVEVLYAADDAVDLCALFVLELELIPAARATLALSSEPRKPGSREQLERLRALGVQLKDAKYTTLLRELSGLSGRAGEDGLLVVSFATHGYMRDGLAKLLAQDSTKADVDITSLPLQAVREHVARSPSRRKLMLLDTCRERVVSSRAAGATETGMPAGFRAAIGEAEGLVVLASTVSGGYSYDDPDVGNGVFTAALLRGMRGMAAADERGFITLDTLAHYADEEVRSWVATHRPEHKDVSRGIGQDVEGLRAFDMPLAIHASTERTRLLGVLKEHLDFQRLTGAMIDQVARTLEEGDPATREQLTRRLRKLDKLGGDYLEDFVEWWNLRTAEGSAPAAAVSEAESAIRTGAAASRELGPTARAEAVQHFFGLGRRIDLAKAAELFEQSAGSGDPVGSMWLARLMRAGLTSDRSREDALGAEASSAVLDRAEAGDGEACYLVGVNLEDGFFGPGDGRQAFQWVPEWTTGGSTASGDVRLAFQWLSRAADLGHAPAMLRLGAMLLTGRGCAQDEVEGAGWVLRAAVKGLPAAQLELGSLQELFWPDPDLASRAMEAYWRAAEGGLDWALLAIAWKYFADGNLEGAESSLREAIAKGNAIARFELASLLERRGRIEEARELYGDGGGEAPSVHLSNLLRGILVGRAPPWQDRSLQGGLLVFRRRSQDLHGLEVGVTSVSEAGHFVLRGLEEGTYHAIYQSAGKRARFLFDVPVWSESTQSIPLPAGAIEGKVLWNKASQDTWVRDARVRLTRPGNVELPASLAGLERESAASGTLGYFDFAALGDGEYELTALPPLEITGADRYLRSRPFRVRLAGGRASPPEAVLPLDPPMEVSGRVVDEDGAPIPGAQVHGWARGERILLANTSADEEGRFLLRSPSGGALELAARAPGFAESELIAVESGLALAVTDVRLEHGPEIRVQVLDQRGAPVAGALVRLLPDGEEPGAAARRREILEGLIHGLELSGRDGRLSLGWHRPGQYGVQLQYQERSATQHIDVTEGPDEVHTLVME